MDERPFAVDARDAVSTAIGVALMSTGTAALVYAIYLEMISAVALRWFHRPDILALASLLMIFVGLLFVRR